MVLREGIIVHVLYHIMSTSTTPTQLVTYEGTVMPKQDGDERYEFRLLCDNDNGGTARLLSLKQCVNIRIHQALDVPVWLEPPISVDV